MKFLIYWHCPQYAQQDLCNGQVSICLYHLSAAVDLLLWAWWAAASAGNATFLANVGSWTEACIVV